MGIWPQSALSTVDHSLSAALPNVFHFLPPRDLSDHWHSWPSQPLKTLVILPVCFLVWFFSAPWASLEFLSSWGWPWSQDLPSSLASPMLDARGVLWAWGPSFLDSSTYTSSLTGHSFWKPSSSPTLGTVAAVTAPLLQWMVLFHVWFLCPLIYVILPRRYVQASHSQVYEGLTVASPQTPSHKPFPLFLHLPSPTLPYSCTLSILRSPTQISRCQSPAHCSAQHDYLYNLFCQRLSPSS